MSSNALLITAGVLVFLEVMILLIFTVTCAEHRRISERILAGRNPALLDEAVREELYARIRSEYDATTYRKFDIACIIFLMPGLATWVMITKNDSPPYFYSLPVAFLFWFMVVWGFGSFLF